MAKYVDLEKVKELIEYIDMTGFQVCPSLFTDNHVNHDCDDCPSSEFKMGDTWDSDVCTDCWKNAAEQSSKDIPDRLVI